MSSLADLPPLPPPALPTPSAVALPEGGEGADTSSSTPDADAARLHRILTADLPPSAAVTPCAMLDCGEDILDSKLGLLEETLAHTEDMEDMHSSVVPLAATLLEISEVRARAPNVIMALILCAS